MDTKQLSQNITENLNRLNLLIEKIMHETKLTEIVDIEKIASTLNTEQIKQKDIEEYFSEKISDFLRSCKQVQNEIEILLNTKTFSIDTTKSLSGEMSKYTYFIEKHVEPKIYELLRNLENSNFMKEYKTADSTKEILPNSNTIVSTLNNIKSTLKEVKTAEIKRLQDINKKFQLQTIEEGKLDKFLQDNNVHILELDPYNPIVFNKVEEEINNGNISISDVPYPYFKDKKIAFSYFLNKMNKDGTYINKIPEIKNTLEFFKILYRDDVFVQNLTNIVINNIKNTIQQLKIEVEAKEDFIKSKEKFEKGPLIGEITSFFKNISEDNFDEIIKKLNKTITEIQQTMTVVNCKPELTGYLKEIKDTVSKEFTKSIIEERTRKYGTDNQIKNLQDGLGNAINSLYEGVENYLKEIFSKKPEIKQTINKDMKIGG